MAVGAAALAAAPTARGAKGSNGCKPFVSKAEESKKESHRTMKLFSWRTDNGFHNSWQIAKCPTNLVHGIAGTKPAARYDSLVSDLKSQLGYAQDLGREPLLTGQ